MGICMCYGVNTCLVLIMRLSGRIMGIEPASAFLSAFLFQALMRTMLNGLVC